MIDFFYCCNVTEIGIKKFFRIYVGFVWLYTHDYAQFGHQESVNVNVRQWKGQEIQRRLFSYQRRRGLSILLIIHYNLPVKKYKKNILFKLVLIEGSLLL